MLLRNIHDPIEDVDEDCLGRHSFARTVLRRLADESCPPAVGLFGDWGTGKSSLLKMLAALNKDQGENHGGNLHIETFDAWLYESTGNLSVPIIVWFIQQLKRKGNDFVRWRVPVKRVLLATGLTAADIGLRLLKVRDLFPEDLGDIPEDFGEIKDGFVENLKGTKDTFSPQRWENLVDDIAQTQGDFQKMVKMALEGERYRRLVICIDNLDRCSPDQAVHLLESIKNYLSVEGVTWVVAVDPHVISAYVEGRYGTGAIGGYNYLDKIFPEQYHIPPLSIHSDAASIDRLLDRALGGPSTSARPTDWQRYAQIPRILVPRRLVKSARKFAEAYRLPTHRGTIARPDTVFALILLYHGWPEFYERLSSERAGHVEGILSNFYEAQEDHREEAKRGQALPLPSRFVDDRDLKYYLAQAFFSQGDLAEISAELASAMRWLQQVGLP